MEVRSGRTSIVEEARGCYPRSPLGSEDRFSQEGGDDGHHPAIHIHPPSHEEEEGMDLRTNPFQEGGDDGRGPSTYPIKATKMLHLRQSLES